MEKLAVEGHRRLQTIIQKRVNDLREKNILLNIVEIVQLITRIINRKEEFDCIARETFKPVDAKKASAKNTAQKMLSSNFLLPSPAKTLSPLQHHTPFSSLNFIDGRETYKSTTTNIMLKHPKLVQTLVSKAKLQETEGFIENNVPEGFNVELMPKHVAVIMDGNRRWALEKGLPIEDGYRVLAVKMKEIACLSADLGIKVLTVFAFSTENWMRPKEEVEFVMSLLEKIIESDLEEYSRKGIKFSTVGDKSKLPKSLQKVVTLAEETTKHNSGLQFIMAMNYGGRQDIIEATKRIAKKACNGLVSPEEIDEELFNEELHTKCVEFPYPDLLIRTSGEQRLSNFLLWQLAYTELLFVEKKFPDFGKPDFIEALIVFQRRRRRYGGHVY